MRLNNIEFERDLNRFARRLDIEVDKVIRKIALDVFTGTTKRTPVDTGALRGSWMIGVNVMERDYVTSGNSATLNAAQKRKLSTVKAGDTINITNNAPYCIVVEYGLFSGSGPKTTSRGYSTQAPKGMLRVTVQEVEAEMARITRPFRMLRG